MPYDRTDVTSQYGGGISDKGFVLFDGVTYKNDGNPRNVSLVRYGAYQNVTVADCELTYDADGNEAQIYLHLQWTDNSHQDQDYYLTIPNVISKT